MENFELFLTERRKLLSDNLNAFLDTITEMEAPVIDLAIDELIQEGESNYLEFKSSLRWSFLDSSVNRKLEEVVVKTIAAFNNTDGGILLVGVNDEGEILGLSNDYESLKGDKDKFELHLQNLIEAEYGAGYCSQYIKVSFPKKDDEEICMVEISRGDKQLYTNITDKHGQKSQKFFIRRGNASVELSNHSEVIEYIEKRFNKNL